MSSTRSFEAQRSAKEIFPEGKVMNEQVIHSIKRICTSQMNLGECAQDFELFWPWSHFTEATNNQWRIIFIQKWEDKNLLQSANLDVTKDLDVT